MPKVLTRNQTKQARVEKDKLTEYEAEPCARRGTTTLYPPSYHVPLSPTAPYCGTAPSRPVYKIPTPITTTLAYRPVPLNSRAHDRRGLF